MGFASGLVLNKCVKNGDCRSPETISAVGRTASVIGIILNLALGAGKFITGMIFGLISVCADGLNNLSDCGTCIVSLVGFKLALKPADREHPFGHHRIEYIASMIVALIVLIVAFELAKESVADIITPHEISFSLVSTIVLVISLCVKSGMFFFYRKLAKTIDSLALKAASVDSVTDVLATAAVLAGMVISHFTGFALDGFLGVVIALVIAFAGINVLKDTFSKLLGQAADRDTINAIKKKIRSYEGVYGVHDLTVHSYGEGVYYASVHVEVDASVPVLQSHELIDKIEKDFAAEGKVTLVVHPDPVVLNDPSATEWKEKTAEIVRSFDPAFLLHDFRFIGGEQQITLIFEVAIPFGTKTSVDKLKDEITQRVRALGENVNPVVTVEYQIE